MEPNTSRDWKDLIIERVRANGGRSNYPGAERDLDLLRAVTFREDATYFSPFSAEYEPTVDDLLVLNALAETDRSGGLQADVLGWDRLTYRERSNAIAVTGLLLAAERLDQRHAAVAALDGGDS